MNKKVDKQLYDEKMNEILQLITTLKASEQETEIWKYANVQYARFNESGRIQIQNGQ